VHAPIDAAARAVAGRGIDSGDIAQVVVRVPEPAVSLVLEPAAAKARPRTPYDAKFSLPYGIAAMLVRGRVDLASYAPEAIAEERVLSLARKVRYEVASFPTFPRAFPGAARVVLKNGDAFESELLHQRGSPENPLTEAEVCDKFRRNARLTLADDDARLLEEAILALDLRSDVRDLVSAGRCRTRSAQPSL